MVLDNNAGYICEGCNGTGWVNKPNGNPTCARCGGSGKITVDNQPNPFGSSIARQIACPSCNGCGYA
jgi:DnaJ-class molecular chaperone